MIGLLLLPAVLVSVGLFGAGLGRGNASEHRATVSLLPGLTQEELETLRERAIQAAAEMGESHPTDGVVVFTTQHRFFNAQDGPTFGTPDFDVYVVAFRGDFVAGGASRPYGAEAPRGHSVYVVYKATRLDMTDWGVGDVSPTLSGIGPSIPLDLGS